MILALAIVAVSGCGSAAPLAPGAAEESGPPGHALIYVIHGDGDYLYHQDGRAKRADIEALREARLVARNAPDAEVFIFHQGSRRSLFGLFPRTDGRFYHYRNGRLLQETGYRRDPAGLQAEAALYDESRHAGVEGATLLYYGHDIPEENDARYHASYPRHPFGIDQFVHGLTLFGADSRPFELIVLSACNNGSPGMVAALAPYTRFVLASPGDLHLSYIDSHPLHRAGRTGVDSKQIARDLADWAFDRLSRRTQTAVTLTLFDTAALTPVLPETERAYANVRANLDDFLPDFVDCRDGAMPDLAPEMEGVTRWFRPPAFGRQSQKEAHSGWGCPISRSARG